MRVAVVIAALVAAAPASAHVVGLSRGLYTQGAEALELELVFARGEAAAAVAGLDGDADGALTDAEVAAAHEGIAATLANGVLVETPSGACPGAVVGATLTEEDGIAIRARFTCAKAERTTVSFALVDKLSTGHKHLAHVVTAEGASDYVAFAGASDFSFGKDAPPPSRWQFIVIGVEHIVFGFDHLVFLFGLILVGGRLRSLLAVVTAFTLAHSVTLALAVLGVVSPPPALVEPLIALSIAYVGIENFYVKSAAGRWRITAPFGLVHGFGFAGALAEIGVPQDDAPLTLLLFNVGVEAGQLAVLSLTLPLLWALRRAGWWTERVTKGASVVVVLLGAFWLVERVVAALDGT